MKKLVTIIIISSLLVAGIASACPGGPDSKVERMMERMANKLKMSSEQEAQFREIMLAHMKEVKAYHEQRRVDLASKLSEVLSVEQLAEFEEISEHRFHRKKGHEI